MMPKGTQARLPGSAARVWTTPAPRMASGEALKLQAELIGCQQTRVRAQSNEKIKPSEQWDRRIAYRTSRARDFARRATSRRPITYTIFRTFRIDGFF
jgi:hypothetical protein